MVLSLGAFFLAMPVGSVREGRQSYRVYLRMAQTSALCGTIRTFRLPISVEV